MEYNESYKTKSVGAYTESLHKFVKGSDIICRAAKKDVRLLDICFGIGLNLAVTFDEAVKYGINNRIHVVSVEKDYSLINIVNNTPILFPLSGYDIVRRVFKKPYKNFSLELYIQDAVSLIYSLKGTFDVIYFDPFSKKHNSDMWSLNIFNKLYSLLDDGGVLMTYASGKQIKEDLIEAGFKISSLQSLGARFQPATKAEKPIFL